MEDFHEQGDIIEVETGGGLVENKESVLAGFAGEVVDKSKTKRKKDGVFYTPKYITKYIVDNTVGRLCEEKKREFYRQERSLGCWREEKT